MQTLSLDAINHRLVKNIHAVLTTDDINQTIDNIKGYLSYKPVLTTPIIDNYDVSKCTDYEAYAQALISTLPNYLLAQSTGHIETPPYEPGHVTKLSAADQKKINEGMPTQWTPTNYCKAVKEIVGIDLTPRYANCSNYELMDNIQKEASKRFTEILRYNHDKSPDHNAFKSYYYNHLDDMARVMQDCKNFEAAQTACQTPQKEMEINKDQEPEQKVKKLFEVDR